MLSFDKIEEITNFIAEKFSPEKIILFGSYAADNPKADSDLDLLVIKETDKPKHHRSFDIRKSLIGTKIPIDILVYTPKEFVERSTDRSSFLFNALKTSRVLYERKG